MTVVDAGLRDMATKLAERPPVELVPMVRIAGLPPIELQPKECGLTRKPVDKSKLDSGRLAAEWTATAHDPMPMRVVSVGIVQDLGGQPVFYLDFEGHPDGFMLTGPGIIFTFDTAWPPQLTGARL